MTYVETPALEAGLDEIRGAPHDSGLVELIVRRPAEDEREVLTEATLDPVVGLVGDLWPTREAVVRRTAPRIPECNSR